MYCWISKRINLMTTSNKPTYIQYVPTQSNCLLAFYIHNIRIRSLHSYECNTFDIHFAIRHMEKNRKGVLFQQYGIWNSKCTSGNYTCIFLAAFPSTRPGSKERPQLWSAWRSEARQWGIWCSWLYRSKASYADDDVAASGVGGQRCSHGSVTIIGDIVIVGGVDNDTVGGGKDVTSAIRQAGTLGAMAVEKKEI